MIRIGKYYYRNFWAFIQVVIFRRPNLRMPKNWKSEPLFKNYDPYDDMSEKDIMTDLLYGDFHEECGDR